MTEGHDEPVAVTDENFGELLVEGLREVYAVSRGEREPARTTLRPIPSEDGTRS